MKTLILATANKNKIQELSSMLSQSLVALKGLTDVGITEAIPETGNTLYKNSLLKAEYVYNRHGGNVMAEDTGLEINALNGEPGVDSAHYANASRDANANMEKVLTKLQNENDRSAQFKTVITLFWDDLPYQFVGIAKGRIATEQSGQGGFGYDPIFIPEGYDQSYAEMIANDKNAISHRRKATDQLIQFISARLGPF